MNCQLRIVYSSEGPDADRFDEAFMKNDLRTLVELMSSSQAPYKDLALVYLCLLGLYMDNGGKRTRSRYSLLDDTWIAVVKGARSRYSLLDGVTWITVVKGGECVEVVEELLEPKHPWAEDPRTVRALSAMQLAMLASMVGEDDSSVREDIGNAGAAGDVPWSIYIYNLYVIIYGIRIRLEFLFVF